MNSTCITRREFARLATSTAAASAFASRASAVPLRQSLGLQLYAVHNLLPTDFDGTLRQVSEAGYREVEAAGYFNKTAAEFRHAMDQAGLRCISAHHSLADLRSRLDELIDFGHTLGLQYIVCSSTGGVHRDPNAKGVPTLDDWRYIASEFNRVGEKLHAAGIALGIHNDVSEFASAGGAVVYDELLRLTDPRYVVFEMDCGWVIAAGRNPIDYLSKTPERFPLLHVKDMTRETGGKMHSVVLGTGVIDYHPILRAATGLKHYFLEQEEFAGDPMTELRADADFMRRIDL